MEIEKFDRNLKKNFFIIIIVTIKFNDPIIDEIPDIWREKIAKSTDGDEWYKYADNGGYTVHPVPGLG